MKGVIHAQLQFHFLMSRWPTLLHLQRSSALRLKTLLSLSVSRKHEQSKSWTSTTQPNLNRRRKLHQRSVRNLQREATRVRQEQEAIDSMSKKLDHVHVSSTVKLNVGGQHFTTSAQTLRKDPNSMLAAMFSGKFDVKPSEDGTHFRFILNYLRTGKLTLPEGATFLKELEEEAEFYEIQGIFDALRLPAQACKPTKPFEESTILTNAERQQILNGWLPTDLKGEWRLLFRASSDGFTAENFHSRCNNKGPTVTIVQSGENIFGGFTEKSWRSKLVDQTKVLWDVQALHTPK